MNVTLRVWRQKNAQSAGRFVEYEAKDINPNMSFLEMLDVVNEELTRRGEEPIAFDSDCREGRDVGRRPKPGAARTGVRHDLVRERLRQNERQ